LLEAFDMSFDFYWLTDYALLYGISTNIHKEYNATEGGDIQRYESGVTQRQAFRQKVLELGRLNIRLNNG
jgi:hypothetical protein